MEVKDDSEKRLVIMRGLPWTGKSYRAKGIAGDVGVIFSTDEFWYKVNKPDRPDEYNFSPRRFGEAHKWNQLRAQNAVENGHPLVVIDNTNVTAKEPYPYVFYAHCQGYKICIEEPTSERWLEIRDLLRDRRANKKVLKEWSFRLAAGSLETHGVPQWSIERMMWKWANDLTAEVILGESFGEET